MWNFKFPPRWDTSHTSKGGRNSKFPLYWEPTDTLTVHSWMKSVNNYWEKSPKSSIFGRKTQFLKKLVVFHHEWSKRVFRQKLANLLIISAYHVNGDVFSPKNYVFRQNVRFSAKKSFFEQKRDFGKNSVFGGKRQIISHNFNFSPRMRFKWSKHTDYTDNVQNEPYSRNNFVLNKLLQIHQVCRVIQGTNRQRSQSY